MEDAAAALLLIALLSCGAGGVALWAQHRERRRSRDAAASARAAVWEPAEQGSSDGVLVFVRRVGADGTEVDRFEVAQVPNDAVDWEARILDARATAARRAGLLNEKA